VSYLNQNLAPLVSADNGRFLGWNLGLDYSNTDRTSQTEGIGQAVKEPITKLWFQDSESEKELENKGHQGLLTNTEFVDQKTGTKLVVPFNYDLDELYLKWSGQNKGVDVYV
jgi:hypothetical protein